MQAPEIRLRESPRVLVDGRARLALPHSGAAAVAAQLLDLSASGMGLAARTIVPVGEMFRFELEEDELAIQGRALVIWSRRPRPDREDAPNLGARFIGLDAEAASALGAFIEHRAAQGRRPRRRAAPEVAATTAQPAADLVARAPSRPTPPSDVAGGVAAARSVPSSDVTPPAVSASPAIASTVAPPTDAGARAVHPDAGAAPRASPSDAAGGAAASGTTVASGESAASETTAASDADLPQTAATTEGAAMATSARPRRGRMVGFGAVIGLGVLLALTLLLVEREPGVLDRAEIGDAGARQQGGESGSRTGERPEEAASTRDADAAVEVTASSSAAAPSVALAEDRESRAAGSALARAVTAAAAGVDAAPADEPRSAGDAPASVASEPAVSTPRSEPVPRNDAAPRARQVLSIEPSTVGAETVVVVRADAPFRERDVFTAIIGPDPPRYLLRLTGVERLYRPTTIDVGAPLLDRVRIGHHDTQRGPELHVVLDLPTRELVPTVEREDAILRVRLRPKPP